MSMVDAIVWFVILAAMQSVAPRPLPDILPPLAARPCAPAFMCVT
jgi:hypothetical protein